MSHTSKRGRKSGDNRKSLATLSEAAVTSTAPTRRDVEPPKSIDWYQLQREIDAAHAAANDPLNPGMTEEEELAAGFIDMTESGEGFVIMPCQPARRPTRRK
jgi:hypothetical protein